MPEYYTHYWSVAAGQKNPILTLDTPENFGDAVDQLPRSMLALEDAQRIVHAECARSASAPMNRSLLRKRSELLTDRLKSFTFSEHSAFLLKHGHFSYNPAQAEAWHSHFPLNKVEVHGALELKPVPHVHKRQSVNEYVRKNEVRASAEELQKSSADLVGADELEPRLSKKVLHMIEVRKRLCTESEKVLDERMQRLEGQLKVKELVHVAEVIKSAFTIQGGGIVLLEEVLERLRDVDSGRITTRGKRLR